MIKNARIKNLLTEVSFVLMFDDDGPLTMFTCNLNHSAILSQYYIMGRARGAVKRAET